MKFLTREKILELSEEQQAEYYKLYDDLRRFAATMVKEISQPVIGSLVSRCCGNQDNYLTYEKSMFTYVSNCVYSQILGETNLEKVKGIKNYYKDNGKKNVTTASILSLPALVHLKNYYALIDHELCNDPNILFHSTEDVNKFLSKQKAIYKKNRSLNFSFQSSTYDCEPNSIIAKPYDSIEKFESKADKSEFPVFDKYTLYSMEVYEYLLSKASVYMHNPLDIKAMQESLQEDRLSVIPKGDLSTMQFYSGKVSEVLERMKGENAKAQIVENLQEKQEDLNNIADNLSQSGSFDNSNDGDDKYASVIKDVIVNRNNLAGNLIDIVYSNQEKSETSQNNSVISEKSNKQPISKPKENPFVAESREYIGGEQLKLFDAYGNPIIHTEPAKNMYGEVVKNYEGEDGQFSLFGNMERDK